MKRPLTAAQIAEFARIEAERLAAEAVEVREPEPELEISKGAEPQPSPARRPSKRK